MAVRRAGPRRVLAHRLGPDTDDPARARPGAPRDRRMEHRVPQGGSGGRRLAGDVRGRRGRGRPSRRARAGRRGAGGDVRALRRRAPRACGSRDATASARASEPPAGATRRGGRAGGRVRPRARMAGRPRRRCGRRACWGRSSRTRTDTRPHRRLRSRPSASRSCSSTAPRRRRPDLAEPRLRPRRDPLASWSSSTGADHFDVVDVEHAAWATVAAASDAARRLTYSTDARSRLRRRARADDRSLQRGMERPGSRRDRRAPRAGHGLREPHRRRARGGRRRARPHRQIFANRPDLHSADDACTCGTGSW